MKFEKFEFYVDLSLGFITLEYSCFCSIKIGIILNGKRIGFSIKNQHKGREVKESCLRLRGPPHTENRASVDTGTILSSEFMASKIHLDELNTSGCSDEIDPVHLRLL